MLSEDKQLAVKKRIEGLLPIMKSSDFNRAWYRENDRKTKSFLWLTEMSVETRKRYDNSLRCPTDKLQAPFCRLEGSLLIFGIMW